MIEVEILPLKPTLLGIAVIFEIGTKLDRLLCMTALHF
jgi:hypothetical protein